MLIFANKNMSLLALCSLCVAQVGRKLLIAHRRFQSMSISQTFGACLSKYPYQSLIIHLSLIQNFGPLLLIRSKKVLF